MSSSNTTIQTKIQEVNVLHHELETLKPGRKVYIQQEGSLVFFKSDKETAVRRCQENLKSIKRECEKVDHKMDISN